MADETKKEETAVSIKPGPRPAGVAIRHTETAKADKAKAEIQEAHERLNERKARLEKREKEAEDRSQGLTRRERKLDERTKSLDVREQVLTGIEGKIVPYGREATACILFTAAQGLLLLAPQKDEKGEDKDITLGDIPEKYRQLLAGTPAATNRSLTLIRAFLNVQVINAEKAGDQKARSNAAKTVAEFEATLRERIAEDKAEAERLAKEAAAKAPPEPDKAPTLANIGEIAQAKAKDRGNKKVKETRNPPSTTEAAAAPTPAETAMPS